MRENSILPLIDRWIDSIGELVPLQACSNPDFEKSLDELIESHLECRGGLIEALLGLRIGAIVRPHQIVQNGTSSLDQYLHGVVHRLEGDYWNSNYWFRQVRDRNMLGKLGREMTHILAHRNVLEASNALNIFDSGNHFIPSRFVDAQESSSRESATDDRDILRQIGHAEWESLWKLHSST